MPHTFNGVFASKIPDWPSPHAYYQSFLPLNSLIGRLPAPSSPFLPLTSLIGRRPAPGPRSRIYEHGRTVHTFTLQVAATSAKFVRDAKGFPDELIKLSLATNEFAVHVRRLAATI